MLATHELSDDTVFDLMLFALRASLKLDHKAPKWEDPLSVFFSVSEPAIETEEYVHRLVRYANCSRSAFINALIYLQRLTWLSPLLRLTPLNLHRLLTTAVVIAAKTLDDRCYSNTHYARVGGISTVAEMNRLELQMLNTLRFRTFVTADEYVNFVRSLSTYVLPSRVSPMGSNRLPSNSTRLEFSISEKASPATVSDNLGNGGNKSLESNCAQTYRFEMPGEQPKVSPFSETHTA